MSHIMVFIACVLHQCILAMSERTMVAVVLANDPIILSCTGTFANWRFLPLNYTGHDTRDKDISIGGTLLPGFEEKGFRITENPQYGLIITDVTSDRAGEYECRRDNEIFNNYKLIVLENIPVCRLTTVSSDCIAQRVGSKPRHECSGSCRSLQSDDSLTPTNNEFIGPNICNIPQDRILVSCSVTYYGNDIPVLELRNLRDNKIIHTPCNTTKLNATIGHYQLTCNITLHATLDLDGTQFIWQTNQSTRTQYNCTTEPIKILYSIDGSTSNHKTAQLHDQLSCTANCSHPCSYIWTWSEKSGNGLSKYEECTKEVMANRAGSYRCEAMCQMRNHLCEVTVTNAIVSSPTVSQQAGSKTSVSIAVAVIMIIGRLLDLWHNRL